jgi:uncharacterized radical SAM superfamily Fe-S cluster-containing enzyme
MDRDELPMYMIRRHPTTELPRETLSICPECMILDGRVEVIEATVFERIGTVVMRKNCAVHGEFEEVIWSEADLYRKAMTRWYETVGIFNPRAEKEKGCPLDCGLCREHGSHTALALIDVTSRCDLSCPICFAGSEVFHRRRTHS